MAYEKSFGERLMDLALATTNPVPSRSEATRLKDNPRCLVDSAHHQERLKEQAVQLILVGVNPLERLSALWEAARLDRLVALTDAMLAQKRRLVSNQDRRDGAAFFGQRLPFERRV